MTKSPTKETPVINPIACLIELVKLKDLKDSKGKNSEYKDRQPKAWKAARACIKQHTNASPKERAAVRITSSVGHVGLP